MAGDFVKNVFFNICRFENLVKARAFTMAEILLSLTIIGVVSAITLPSLIGNFNEKVWNTQRKALYSRMSQAISLMPNLNNYGTYSVDEEADDLNSQKDDAAETFLSAGLARVLKINNICDNTHIADCGFAGNYIDYAGSKKSWASALRLSGLNERFIASYEYGQNPQAWIDTKAAAFETANGESVLLFYNPYCMPNNNEVDSYYVQPKMCANFVYDLNGKKGPNTIGKDMGFITALYSTDSKVVAPIPVLKNIMGSGEKTQINAGRLCLVDYPDSRLPNIEELSSIYYNQNLIGVEQSSTGSVYWSSSVLSASIGWRLWFDTGKTSIYNRVTSAEIRCIKR